MSRTIDDPVEDWYRTVPRSITRSTALGGVVLFVTFVLFGAWSATAPLAAAVVANGTFVAIGQNKFVQHFEGGIIKQILVSEGDRVEKGQVLMLLDKTGPLADYRRLSVRLARYEAIAARLSAMSKERGTIDFSAVTTSPDDDDDIRAIKAAQMRVMNSGRAQLDGKIGILRKNLDSLSRRLEGSRAQRQAVQLQIELIAKEVAGKRALVAQGLMRSSELFAVERAAAEADGALGRLEAEIGDTTSQIMRASSEMEQARQDYRQKAIEDLQSVSGEIDDVKEQLQKAGNILERTEVRAPVAGTLVKLYYHTPGGVIESGKQIVEILPEGQNLLIEAIVRPSDIDSIKVGQPASVRLTSFNRRTTPQLDGKVTYVSADTLPDPRTGRDEGYVARVLLDDTQMARIQGLRITPGMPAELFIETAERTFLGYLTKPIRDSMQRAFREH